MQEVEVVGGFVGGWVGGLFATFAFGRRFSLAIAPSASNSSPPKPSPTASSSSTTAPPLIPEPPSLHSCTSGTAFRLCSSDSIIPAFVCRHFERSRPTLFLPRSLLRTRRPAQRERVGHQD